MSNLAESSRPLLAGSSFSDAAPSSSKGKERAVSPTDSFVTGTSAAPSRETSTTELLVVPSRTAASHSLGRFVTDS